MKHVDDITMLQRRDEILSMNKSHIDLATKIRQKVDLFVDTMSIAEMKPGDAVQLLKLSAELEKNARIDTLAQEEQRNILLVDSENPDLKKAPTNQADLQEVVNILLKAGALGTVTKVGVKQTTEVVMVDESGNTSSMELAEEN
jgi:hypothetical protein